MLNHSIIVALNSCIDGSLRWQDIVIIDYITKYIYVQFCFSATSEFKEYSLIFFKNMRRKVIAQILLHVSGVRIYIMPNPSPPSLMAHSSARTSCS